jgi:hypothetical protein
VDDSSHKNPLTSLAERQTRAAGVPNRLLKLAIKIRAVPCWRFLKQVSERPTRSVCFPDHLDDTLLAILTHQARLWSILTWLILKKS